MDYDSSTPGPSGTGPLERSASRLDINEPSTPREAEVIIERIRAEKGHVDEDTRQELNNISSRSRQNVMRSFERNREMEAQFTRSVSEQLYSSRFRFLYELIQNADDSPYSNAAQKNTAPFLRFIVTPRTFIAETNEDGFKRVNVEAICATGKSSKNLSALDTSIGEKGFGFKSVFSVANEVHIQSGVWSFRFSHMRGDDGLGMVTPLHAPAESLPEDITTRITLALSNTAIQRYQDLLDALTDIPETTIFFLRTLQRIEIHANENDSLWTMTVIRKEQLHEVVNITRTVRRSGEELDTEATERSVYQVFTRTVTPMPEDERRQGRNNTRIDLAFPVDLFTGQPKLSERGQHIFAYLPLHRLPGLQFIIQSNFITSASRESVADCAWNDAIRDDVAKAFTDAVTSFATNDGPLQFSWLEYIPNVPMDGFWGPLYSSIKTLLGNTPIFQTWQGRQYKFPRELRVLPSTTLHERQPIFRDLRDEIYLAPEYSTRHGNVLADLGATIISWDQILQRMSADLTRTDSYFKTRAPNHAWHRSCAQLLLYLFRDRSTATDVTRRRVKQLAIIPINGGRSWTGAPGIGPGGVPRIYFPTTENIPIPNEISLSLVEEIAASDAMRKDLFRAMGVEECSREAVCAEIESFHRRSDWPSFDYRTHFRYLFNFHTRPDSIREWIRVPTETGRIERPSSSLYLLSTRDHDTQNLLPDSFRVSSNNTATFVWGGLTPDWEPLEARPQNLPWRTWLRRVTNARYHPPLTQLSGSGNYELSKVLRAVLEHNPEKFVGALKAHWMEYRTDARHIMSQLRESMVPSESGELIQLQMTFLPTVEIKARLRSLQAENGFPLLKLPSPLDETNHQDWRFLDVLGVYSAIDIKFYELVLERMIGSAGVTIQHVTDIYQSMAQFATIRVREFFNTRHSIAIEDTPNTLEWVLPSHCVWDGPEFLTVKVPLRYYYGGESELETFFRNLLEIQDSSQADILEELDHMRELGQIGNRSISEASRVYRFLEETAQTGADRRSLRNAFSQRQLVMGDGGRWQTLQSCLWNSPFSLTGYQNLSRIYPGLENFFVNYLNVPNANPTMLVNELRGMAIEREPRIEDIRRQLIHVGGIIARSGIDEPLSRALNDLMGVPFLPKRTVDGTLELVSVQDDFAILDHDRFGAAFADHYVLLNFERNDVQILDTMFKYMSLTRRYLSVSVKERSTVSEDAVPSEALGQSLQAKAYALFCCATKYKSIKALPGERELFDQLSRVQVFTTDNISTHLVLDLRSLQVRAQSDRPVLHHELSEGQLKIYVPNDQRTREACFRSQLPRFLTTYLGLTPTATLAVSEILRSDPIILENILSENDIPHVDWIEQSAIELPGPSERRGPSTPAPAVRHSDPSRTSTVPAPAPSRSSSSILTPNLTPGRSGALNSPLHVEGVLPSTPTLPRQYERLIEHVVQSAQRESYRQRPSGSNAAPTRETPPRISEPVYDFDHEATFGDRSADEMAHDRRIGAAGELYVFETLSRLGLPGFDYGNWRSTIRGELQAHAQYADLANWAGRETADLVYIDRDGSLTQWLRQHCSGRFPDRIAGNHDFATQPIEYFLEVKTTTGPCQTRFFMSGSQFNRMEALAIPISGPFGRVYVIIRVFNLEQPQSMGMRIFVDPLSLRGQYLEFEVGTWLGRTIEGTSYW